MPTPRCNNTVTADASADGMNSFSYFVEEDTPVAGDPAKTTGSSPPVELFAPLFPSLMTNAYAGPWMLSSLSQAEDCADENSQELDLNQAALPFLDIVNQNETPKPVGDAQDEYQILKIGTYTAWNYLSYLFNRSQFTRYYLEGVYPYRLNGSSTLWSRSQIHLAENTFIPANLRGQHSPANDDAVR